MNIRPLSLRQISSASANDRAIFMPMLFQTGSITKILAPLLTKKFYEGNENLTAFREKRGADQGEISPRIRMSFLRLAFAHKRSQCLQPENEQSKFVYFACALPTNL